MKHILLPIAGLVAGFSFASAQTITSSWSPSPWGAAKTMVVEDNMGLPAGSAGQSQNWDYSSLSSDTFYVETIVPPAGQIGASDFPDATVARIITNGNYTAATYFQGTSAVFSFLGSYAESGGIGAGNIYSDPLDLVRYPVGFGQSYTDTYDTEWTTIGLTYSREGTLQVEVDGTGTLTTPAGTFSNVVRVKSIDTYQYIGLPPIPGSSTSGVTTQYNYISQDYPGIFLLTYGITDDNIGNVDTSISYGDPSFQLIEEIAGNETSVFPVPASNNINITSAEGISSVTLFDISGRESSVTFHKNSSKATIGVADLPAGVYVARILLNSGSVNSRRIVIVH